MLTDQSVIGLSFHFILVVVPVGHPALIIAVLLWLAASGLGNDLSAVMAQDQIPLGRMPLKIGFDGIGRKIQCLRDPLIAHTNGGIEIDLVHGFVCHRMSPF